MSARLNEGRVRNILRTVHVSQRLDITKVFQRNGGILIGGVIMPANMARECWKPRSRASTNGILSLSPKNGEARVGFFMNGRFGLKRNAS